MLEQLQAMVRGEDEGPPIARLIGFRLMVIEPGEAVVELQADGRHANPMGTLHGGVLCDIADAAMGIAYASLLEDDETFTTLEMKINYVRPLRREAGEVRCEASVIHVGGRVATAEGRIVDANGKLYAHGTATCMLFRE